MSDCMPRSVGDVWPCARHDDWCGRRATSADATASTPNAMPPMGTLISRGHGTEDGGVRIMNKLIPALFLLSLLNEPMPNARLWMMDSKLISSAGMVWPGSGAL